MPRGNPGRVRVIAGVNGAGKSSVLGAAVRARGGQYYNPDEFTLSLLSRGLQADPAGANSLAWQMGREGLERAIAERGEWTFETTLGGTTITSLLQKAAKAGLEVHLLYVGLRSPALHVARVKARVAAGGHDIPEATIRERYDASRRNLVRLLPHLASLRVFDNSVTADPAAGVAPQPLLVLAMEGGAAIWTCALEQVPNWARPIVSAALRLQGTATDAGPA